MKELPVVEKGLVLGRLHRRLEMFKTYKQNGTKFCTNNYTNKLNIQYNECRGNTLSDSPQDAENKRYWSHFTDSYQVKDILLFIFY